MKRAPIKHNRLRRMDVHDYTSACIYLITVTTEGRKRILGSLVGDSAETSAARITRAQCLNMNDFAEDLASVALKCSELDEDLNRNH